MYFCYCLFINERYCIFTYATVVWENISNFSERYNYEYYLHVVNFSASFYIIA